MPTLLKTPSGPIVDRARLMELPFHLLINQPDNRILVPAQQQVGPLALTVSKEAPALIDKFSHSLETVNDGGKCTVILQIQDGAAPARRLMPTPVELTSLFGSGQKPYFLPQALWIEEDHVLTAFLYNYGSADCTVCLDAGDSRNRKPTQDPMGKLAQDRLKRRTATSAPYWYTPREPIVLTGNGTAQALFEISNEGYFELWTITGASDGHYSLDIINQATGDALIMAPNNTHFEVDDRLLVGTGEFPNKLREPWLVGAGQTVIANITDLSGIDNNVFLTLGGVFFATGPAR